MKMISVKKCGKSSAGFFLLPLLDPSNWGSRGKKKKKPTQLSTAPPQLRAKIVREENMPSAENPTSTANS